MKVSVKAWQEMIRLFSKWNSCTLAEAEDLILKLSVEDRMKIYSKALASLGIPNESFD